jgi:hypothetical protein
VYSQDNKSYKQLIKQNRRATRTPPNTGCEEEFEDNQRGNQNLYIEEEQITNGQKKKYKGQTTIYKT